MRIGFFGDGGWAERALLQLTQDDRYTIAFVAVRASRPDWKLIGLAEQHGIPALCPTSINSAESISEIGKFKADLHVSMSYDQILREAILDLPARGTLNCHAGALPFYRGRNPLTWAIINGEEEFGVTVHWVDLGIDTGDIVLQIKAPIGPDDTYATLMARAEELCASALVKAISDVYENKDQRIAQATIDPVGMYCCRRRAGDEEIDWSSQTLRIERFIRALVPPGPGARTSVEGVPYAILAAQMVDHARPYIGAAGEVIGRDDTGILVKSGDTWLRLTRWAPVQPDGSLGEAVVPDARRGVRLGRELSAALARVEAQVAALEAQLGLRPTRIDAAVGSRTTPCTSPDRPGRKQRL
jgi:methionyl-tRNA formyltransferase